MGWMEHDGLASTTDCSGPTAAELWVDGHERKTNTGMKAWLLEVIFYEGESVLLSLGFG